MIGIAVGLLVVAVAMGALMVSRGVTGTVGDASGIQQQAAYVLRVMGLQLRQAGSMRLNLDPGTTAAAETYLIPVAFETAISSANSMESFNPAINTLGGTDSPVSLTAGSRRYTEPVFGSSTEQALVRNCVGGPADNSPHVRLESVFALDPDPTKPGVLRCAGNGAAAQPIADNVANFQVRYIVQDNTTTPGIPTLKTVNASGVTSWGQVQAVEVCLVFYGTEAMDLPSGSNYIDCDGSTVDMSTLTGKRARRMHIAFHNVFQLRSQGLIGSVL
ncbi:MAG: PilW family protein [Giesbergeria sp.]|uniref:PilW family protein n=1 Tax=Giesbergeria sp. TaxID=2818473 RepID=UPI0026328100|nr:PilW family protein [Giesbergeria sp.]MDD2608990.1 PilW family protein [Giesbergeria sp.]